jgi:hypothetical protein
LISYLLVMLLAFPVGHCQEQLTLAKRPDAAAVAIAKETLRSAVQAPTQLPFGGFAIIDIKLEGKLTTYIVPGSDDCIKTIALPKGQGYVGWFVPKGETLHKWTVIEPIATHDRLIVTGTSVGTTTLIWMTVKDNEAVVVASFQFVVGTPKPPPPPPDLLSDFEKSIKKALDVDLAAGKGIKAHAESLAGIYRDAANSLPSVTTAGELYNALQSKIASAGIPPPAISLPTMRALIAAELNKRLPTETDRQLTLEDRNRLTATFGAMADSLEAILK